MYQKLIIIGAPRSGTNMLRNTLVKLNGVETWPCDEINYIWRYGNARATTDEFTPEMASDKTKAYIQRAFNSLAEKTGAETVVEKTCANSLRVSFVNAVVPDAKYIFIVRDGMDAIASASLRWRAKLDILYLAKKLRYVPLVDIPYYGSEYIKVRLHMKSASDGRQAYWGPKIKALDNSSLENLSIMEVCAIQWRACVEKSTIEIDRLDKKKVFKIKYEDFVSDPGTHIQKLSEFIGLNVSRDQVREATREISSNSVGKGRKNISEVISKKIEPIIRQTMIDHGYVV